MGVVNQLLVGGLHLLPNTSIVWSQPDVYLKVLAVYKYGFWEEDIFYLPYEKNKTGQSIHSCPYVQYLHTYI